MAKLAFSTRRLIGAIVFFAEEVPATIDALTKPAADNAAWKEVAAVENLKHNPRLYTEEYSIPDPVTGWRDGKDEFTFGDNFDLTTREMCELVDRLSFGLGAAAVANTAQSPFANSNRMVRGWIKIQHRKPTGLDQARMDVFVEIRLKEDPAAEKKVQVPVFELWALASTLNSYVNLG